MKYWKSHFVFNKSERNGIFVLVILIIILQILYFKYPFFSAEEKVSEKTSTEITQFQHSLDSLKQKNSKKDTIYPFNPNYLTDYKAYRLGMSVKEIDRLLDFRSSGKWINSAEEFQEITKISDSLFVKLSPHFKFPDWVSTAQTSNSIKQAPILKLDLNLTTAQELQKVKGVGQVLSNRIVKYRELIGGYRSLIQLKDIYGLPDVTRKELLKYLNKIPPNFDKKNINTIGILELSELPYFNYELARAVIEYRNLHKGIDSIEVLSKIDDFPRSKFDRIQLYLSFN
ncbi:ComEA family DNA-binding protein [Zunongwangia pacifica]|uniref:Helix-hairpin-helix domain-containing protein n=1 Tax=Zunongwangia pacifica TaxID=2911062 RepID=A0A9X2CNW1_9FLAO|nr:helix-hairpin-helix domain-containing protein [Zunongwangia pacifica]MCL6219134.1 helix-hairpin-helix domain-containing protein [Zunongwangia pacifica]